MKGRWLFVILAAGLLLAAAAQDKHDDEEEVQTLTGFQVPEYDKDGKVKSRLYGDLAQILPRGIVKITNLRIEFYDEEEVNMRVTAPECSYHQKKKVAESDTGVRIARGNMVVTGVGFVWDSERERLQIFNDAKVVLKDVRSKMEPGEEP